MAIDNTPYADLIQQLRTLNPDKAKWSDDQLLWNAHYEAQQQGVLNQFPELERYNTEAIKDARPWYKEAAGAFGAGVDQFQSKLYDTAALAGDLVGSESLQQWGDEGRDRNQEEAAKFQPIVGALEKVKTPSDFGYWLTNIVASQAPQLAGTVAGATGATLLAPEAAIAGFLGAAAVGFTQMQNYGELKKMGGEDVLPIAIANGLIGAALEAKGPASAIARFVKSGIKKEMIETAAKTLLDRVPAPIMRTALAAAKEGSTEMLTEMAQEAATIGSEIVSNRRNPDFAIDDKQIVSRLINNGAAGFVLGGGLGALSGYAEGKHTATAKETKALPMEQPAPVVEASLDAPIPPLAQPAVAPQPVATPAPTQATTTVAPVAAEAPVLATPATQEVLRQLGVSAEQAATIPEAEAQQIIAEAARQRAAAPAAPVAANPQITQQEVAAAAQRAQQQEAEAALQRAQVEADAREELAAAQPEIAQPQPTRAPAAPTAKILPFPIPQQPGETRLTPTAEGEPAIVQTSLSPAEIRRRANLQRMEGDNIVDVDFNTGEIIPIKRIAPPTPFPAPQVLPTQSAPAQAAPAVVEPAERKVNPSPIQNTKDIPYVDNRLVSDRYVEGTQTLEPGDTTRLSRRDGDAERVTRNAAILRTADGKTLFVPVYTDRSGQVNVVLRESVKQKDVIPQVAAQAEQIFGRKFSEITVQRILEGTISETKPENAQRNAQIRAIGKELGYARRSEPVSQPLTDLQKEMNATIVGIHHFENPVPAGVREFPGNPDDLATAIKAARTKSAEVYKEGLLNPSAVPEGKVSLNAPVAENASVVDLVPDTRAAIPGQSAPALPSPVSSPVTPALVEPGTTNLPPHARIGFSEEQAIDLASQVGDVDALLQLKAADLTKRFRDEFRNEILSNEQRKAFDLLSADEQLRVMRGALTEAKINSGDDMVLHRAQPEDYRASVPRVQETYNRVLRAAAMLGIDVSVFQTNEGAANKFFHDEGGAYLPSKRTITLVANDVLNPSWQNVVTALHEVVHDVVANEPVWVQKALHDMIERLPLGETAFYKNPDADPRVAQGGGANIERLVEHLTLRGLSQEHSASIISQIVRAITHAVTKVALYLQTKFLGAENTSGKLAKAYAENRVAQILGGDLDPGRFLAQFGSKPEMIGMRRLVFANHEWHLERFEDGARVYPLSTQFSNAAAIYNNTSLFAALKEAAQLDGTVDKLNNADELASLTGEDSVLLRRQPSEELKARFEVTRLKAISNTRIDVAVANQVARLYDRLFAQVTEENKDADRAQFFADHRVTDPVQVKQTAIDSLKEQLEIELGEKLTELPFDDKILIDQLPANEKALGTYKLSVAIAEQLARSSTQYDESSNRTVTLRARINRNAEAVQRIDKQLTDIMASDKIARDYLRDYLRDLSKDLKRDDESAVAFGELNATLNELEGRTNKELSTQFTDRVLNAIGVDTLPLPAIFKELFARERNGDFDLSADKPSVIRDKVRDFVTANPDSNLASLVEFGEGRDAKSKGTALLGAIITLAKDQAHIVDTIRLQLTETTEAKQQLLALRSVLNETREARLAEALDKAKNDLKSPGSKAIYSWLKRRERAITDQKSLERQEAKARYLRPSIIALKDTLARIDQRLGVGHNLNIVPGEKLMVPPSADATSEAVRANLVEITMGRERWLKSEQVKDILKAQRDWMDARKDKPELHDEIYNTIARNHEKLMTLLAADDIHTTLGRLASGKHDSLMEELRRTNTRAGEAAARNVMEFSRIERGNANVLIDLGKKWEVASEQFYKAANLSPEQAKEIVYDPAFFFMGELPGVTEDEALVKLREVFADNPMTQSIAADEKTWRLLVNWLKLSTEVNKTMQGVARGSGLFVRDEKLTRVNPATGREEAAYRPALEQGVTDYTLPQRIHGHVGAIISRFSGLFKVRGDSDDNPFHATALKMQLNPDAVSQALHSLIDSDPEFRTRIVEPLLTDTSRTKLPLPNAGDGRSVYVPPAAAERAYAESNGDILEFAKRIYQRYGVDGSTEALREYQARVVKFLGDGIVSLDRQINPAEKPFAGLKGLAHYAMDARVASNFPRSWLTYDQFSAEDNRHALHTIASNSAFGRNFERQDRLYDAIHQELEARANELKVADRDALLKEKGKDWFALREDADKKLGRVDTYKALTRSIMNPASGATDDFGPLMEIYSGVLSGMVFGLKGAIKNTLSIMDTLTLERNLSVKSAATVVKGYASFGRNFLAGLVGTFGPDLLKYNRNIRLIDEAGGFDVAKNVNATDWFKGTRGVNNNFDKRAGGKVQRLTRMARMFASNARLGFSEGNTGPLIRAFNQFAYTQLASNYAVTDALLSRFDEIANLGADYYDATGHSGAKLTAKAIGYSDSTGFEALRNEAQLAGFTFEEIAEKAQRRRAKQLEIFDKDTVQKVMNMTLSRVAGEAGAASRPSYMLTSKFARANSALVGWSFFKSAQVARLMRDPQGRRDLLTLANGAKVMALGLVPLAVAFSLMLDEYDDKLTGKRSNLKPITQDDFFSAVIERSVAMGSFGIAGNVPDTLLNVKDGTGRWGLSVDQSIVWLNSVTGLLKALSAGYNMGWDNLNYANFYRPIAQSFGTGGLLQYVQIADHLFPEATRGLPVFEQEAGVTARINAGNLLRAAGRQIGLEVRSAGGAGTPNEVTPWITNMSLAAYRDDREAFQEAFAGAVKAAAEHGEPDPVAYVKRAFQSRHPLKSIFRTAPTEAEYQQAIGVLDETGRNAVESAVNLFNTYGRALGIDPYYGAEGASTKLLNTLIKASAHKPTARLARKTTVSEMQALLASRRMGEGDGL